MEQLNYVVEIIRKVYGKRLRTAYVYTSTEDKVAARQWPAGGFADIRKAVQSCISSLNVSTLHNNLKRKDYNNFMGILCSSVYCCPQGRVAAVESLTLGQVYYLST